MSKIYIYVVARDFGFAPNPFHAFCTLATCKPKIRQHAEINDWVVGMGGSRLKAEGQCIFAMRITNKVTFDDYWNSSTFLDKKPVRNGSRRMMVGDNIYHKSVDEAWLQADSHHSNPDGSTNLENLKRDTGADAVLLSSHFFYFGKTAPVVPAALLNAINYKNARNYRVFEDCTAHVLIEWLYNSSGGTLNQVMGDPFDFENSEKRYLGTDNKIQ